MPVPVFLAGETLTAAKLQQLNEGWTAYTPALTASTTNPTLGTGGSFAQEGSYLLEGDWVHVFGNFRFGTSGPAAGSGTYRIGLPAAAPAISSDRADVGTIGGAELGDDSTGNRYRRALALGASTYLVMPSFGDPFTEVTNSSPFTWAASDYIIFAATYRSAA